MKLRDLEARLTEQQRLAAHMITDNEFGGKEKTLDDIAEEVGVSRTTLYTWRTNGDFTAYQSALSDAHLNKFRSEVDARLMDLIIKGPSNNGVASIKALELYYGLIGRKTATPLVQIGTKPLTPQLTDDEVAEGLAQMSKKLEQSKVGSVTKFIS
ncbi:hypothetical protein CEF21_14985 [Bacillus sp. FJAT-42376]|uniref:phBC6A51 family helix-turn-helix protein n=1 Tax=Bacillus sp. FJAT-42376 TaxID=2014076 RepID=UPI000F513ACB|nr:phBC6A51 family helix-turn-helix protein [Bacillus sp. FJAT-42376]AZB43500.1 hypothetical protein CEF21_14985 [Bacillus sp. FJAT-42376]